MSVGLLCWDLIRSDLGQGDADGFAPGRSETSVVTLRAGSVAVNVPSEETARLPDC